MNAGTKKRWWLLAVFLLLATPVAALYEGSVYEDIFLVRPDNEYIPESIVPVYLSSEDLTFYACVEQDDVPVRLSVLCKENNDFIDVETQKWGTENCFIGSIDLDDFPCYEATLTADYLRDGENQRMTKDVQINKITGALQRVLDTQFEDGGWSSALDTAYSLFSLKPFESVFADKIKKGLLYLKDSRHETDKCWPAEECQVSTTAMITYLLSQAEYDDSLRIIHDATLYLERSMNYITSGETWTVTLEDFRANENNSVRTSCVYGYDSTDTTVNLSVYGTETEYDLSPSYGSVIRVVCTENVYIDITSSARGTLIHYEGDNLSYTIPQPCWTFNNENVTCDIRATALAIGTPVSDDRKEAASNYLVSLLTGSVIGKQFPDGDIMNLAIFMNTGAEGIVSSDIRDEAEKYLLYRQTNTGSWNTTATYYNYSYYEPQEVERTNFSHVLEDNYTRSIIYTGYVVQMLLDAGYTRQDEPVQDAGRWLSLYEETVSKQLTEEELVDAEIVAAYEENVSDVILDPKRNGMALYVLEQHTRPFIKSNPRTIILDKQNLTLELVNPTTFSLEDLSYDLSPELQPYVEIETKDYLAPYSYRKIQVRQLSDEGADVFGYLRITSGSNEYAKIPVIVVSYPSLSVTFPKELIVFGSSTIVALNISKSAHNFSCDLKWETSGISTLSSFDIQRDGLFNLPVQFLQAGTEERDYTGVLTCKAQTSTFTFPFTLRVNRFITRPMSVGPNFLNLNTTDSEAWFYVKNLLDESIDVTISLRDENASLDFSDYFLTLYPGETRNVSVYLTSLPGENVSIVNSVVVRTFNIEERIPLSAEVIHEAEPARPLWMVMSAGIFGVGLVALGLYFGYTNRKKLFVWYQAKFKKESVYKRLMANVEDYEQKEIALAIKNMVQILKMEGVSDGDIRKRLAEQGFSDQEVTTALKMKVDDEKAPATAPKK
jgi:hypothetical protein